MRLSSIALAISVAYGGFSPASLFAAGEQGVWYDPSDLTTMFQDSAGTTPVTSFTSNQPVGLLLDKSKGLVLGPELVTNGDFAVDANWTKPAGFSISGGALNYNGTGSLYSKSSQSISLIAGQSYRVTFKVSSISSSTLYVGLGRDLTYLSNYATVSTATSYSVVLVASAGDNCIVIQVNSAAQTFSIDDVSVKLVPGNHATASGSARPVLSKRYNLLTRTEEFDNAVWTKGDVTVDAVKVTDPFGGTTAQQIFETTTNGAHFATQSISVISGASYTFSVYVKPNGRDRVAIAGSGGSAFGSLGFGVFFNCTGAGSLIATPSTGVATITLANGFYRITYTWTAGASASGNIGLYLVDTGTNTSYAGDVTKGMIYWGADLRRTIDANAFQPAYQRVVTATDYDGDGFLPYLEYSGAQAMSTGSVDFTAGDKMSVWAGVTKLSDAVDGILAELSINVTGAPGSFYVTAPEISFFLRYAILSRGSAVINTNQIAGTSSADYNSPITNVLTGTMNIAGDSNILRLNGTQVAQAAGDQGAGNYGNYPLYIGARAASSLFFNGRQYSLIVRGAQSSAAQISATESWVAQRTGVSL